MAASLALACNAVLGIEEAELIEGAGGQSASDAGAPCQHAGQCDDDNVCTADDCDTTVGRCTHDPLPNGPAGAEQQTDGDCRLLRCQLGEEESSVDDNDIPVDDNPCTADTCSAGTPSNPPADDGANCDQDGGKVCYQSNCVECIDATHCAPPDTCGGAGVPNQCGCAPTACDQVTCGWRQDALCHNPPQLISCNNGQQDGTETDVDCGGEITTCNVRCGDGKNCEIDQDCANPPCGCGICGNTGGCGAGGAGGGA